MLGLQVSYMVPLADGRHRRNLPIRALLVITQMISTTGKTDICCGWWGANRFLSSPMLTAQLIRRTWQCQSVRTITRPLLAVWNHLCRLARCPRPTLLHCRRRRQWTRRHRVWDIRHGRHSLRWEVKKSLCIDACCSAPNATDPPTLSPLHIACIYQEITATAVATPELVTLVLKCILLISVYDPITVLVSAHHLITINTARKLKSHSKENIAMHRLPVYFDAIMSDQYV